VRLHRWVRDKLHVSFVGISSLLLSYPINAHPLSDSETGVDRSSHLIVSETALRSTAPPEVLVATEILPNPKAPIRIQASIKTKALMRSERLGKAKDLLVPSMARSIGVEHASFMPELQVADGVQIEPFSISAIADPLKFPDKIATSASPGSVSEVPDGLGSISPPEISTPDRIANTTPESLSGQRPQDTPANQPQILPPLKGNPGDPNLPPLIPPPPPPRCLEPDPELGCLLPGAPISLAPPTRFPVMYLVPRIDFFSSSNILSGVDPVNDGLVRPSLSVLLLPQLGPRTFFIASAEGSLNRYLKLTRFDYDEIRFRAGVSHQLSPNMTAELGWSNQQLYIASDDIPGFSRGKRFLDDHAVRLEISRRDQLAKKLSLNSFYQLRASFAQPEDRSRIINVIFLSLNYDITPKLQLGLDYQFAAANFTQQTRTDLYHQVLTRLTYTTFRNAQLSVYGGFSSGSSTASGINFDGFLLGIGLSVNLTLF
jgi:hypothetical protein